MAYKNEAFRSHIAKGADILDVQYPLWERKIDLHRFRMDGPLDDILGQLFGSFAYGLSCLRWPRDVVKEATSRKVSSAMLLGFSCLPSQYAEAEAEWRIKIAERLGDSVTDAELNAVEASPYATEEVNRIVRSTLNARLCDGCGVNRPYDPEHPEEWSITDADGCLWRFCVTCTRDRKKTKCARCDGDGKAHGADRPFEWHGPGTYPGPCPKCNGTGVEPVTHERETR